MILSVVRLGLVCFLPEAGLLHWVLRLPVLVKSESAFLHSGWKVVVIAIGVSHFEMRVYFNAG